MKLRTFLVVLAFLVPTLALAGVYKWTDAQGRVHYSDKPPGFPAEELNIRSERTNPEAVQARLAAASAAVEAQTQANAEANAAAVESDEDRLRREENCARARRALDSLVGATRIYDPLPGGERRYLEQEEIDERLTKARQNVEEWCTGNP